MKRRWLAAAVMACMLGPQYESVAAPLVYQFSGAITVIPPSLQSVFQAGNSFTGQFTVDDQAVDSDGTPELGSYIFSVQDFQMQIGSSSLLGLLGGDLQVGNGPSSDTFTVASLVKGPKWGDATPSLAALQLTGGATTEFSSDAIPLAIDPSHFSNPDFTLDVSTVDSLERLVGRVNQITLVPEPTGICGMALLFGMSAYGRSSRRRGRERLDLRT